MEIIDHLFGDCSSLVPLWQLKDLKDWIFIITFNQFKFLDTLNKVKTQKKNISKFIFLILSIWKEVNSIIFPNESRS